MKYLIVKPAGGLANRMRMLESAYNYAKKYNADFTFIWERNGILNAKYSDCFAALPGAKLIEVNYNGWSVAHKIKRKLFDSAELLWLSFFVQKKIDDTYIEGILTENGLANEQSTRFFDETARANKGVFIKSCYEFYPNETLFRLTIQDYIQRKAVASLQGYSSLVGVHIRQTDHVHKASSPVERYITEIKSNIAASPGDAYYLSTDSEEVVQQLRNLFTDKIITGVSVRSRESKEGIIAGLMDLYCLSRCKIILGSYKSSFSERAAIIGNVPLKIMTA